MTRRRTIIDSRIITKLINASDRCLHINEFLPKTIYNLHFLRRIKYYHLICQNKSLSNLCFHDGFYFCKCDYVNEQYQAFCFVYERDSRSSYPNTIQCYSDGEYFVDDEICPTRVWCVCPRCFYGTQCQFTTSGFGLSLDTILSYHIQPHVNLTHQSTLVQITAALSIIFIIIGLVNGVLSLMTFKNQVICEVGCGIYLLAPSITTLLTTIFFGLKVWILLLAQMSIIENRTFLTIQCYSIDFFLRVCLYVDQWLNACVAFERTVCAIKGIRFDRSKSKQISKIMIIILIIFNIGTSIHDPIYRQLIDEEHSFEEDDDSYTPRLWCIINYKSTYLVTYNHVIHTFNFFAPFLINLLSAIVLIANKSRRRVNIQNRQTFFNIFREQFHEHRHLLFAPIILVLLAIPRLIMTYTTKCMESQCDVWLYLIIYFVSFIPPMLTLVIFVLPSKVYKKELGKTMQEVRKRVQNGLRIIRRRGRSH